MINRGVKAHIKSIDNEIENLMVKLQEAPVIGNDYYDNLLERIEKLAEIRTELTPVKTVDKNGHIILGTLITGAFSIAQLYMIMNHEKENIITTKSMAVATKWLGR